jgi:hypothetical protein
MNRVPGWQGNQSKVIKWAIESVKIENGVFGMVASADAFIQAFSKE